MPLWFPNDTQDHLYIQYIITEQSSLQIGSNLILEGLCYADNFSETKPTRPVLYKWYDMTHSAVCPISIRILTY